RRGVLHAWRAWRFLPAPQRSRRAGAASARPWFAEARSIRPGAGQQPDAWRDPPRSHRGHGALTVVTVVTKMPSRIRFTVVAVALALGALLPVRSSAFVTNGVTWPQSPVPFRINTTNMDGLSDAAVIAALRAGADTWPQQSGASIALSYAGPSS